MITEQRLIREEKVGIFTDRQSQNELLAAAGFAPQALSD
jgi:hypothetical protein